MKYLIGLSLMLLSGTLSAQKARKYDVVTAELSQNVINTQVSTVPFRLAVVPFTATKFSVEASTQFGDYLTETIIGALAGHPAKIKLFERTRLDAVLKEQEFILSDLMKPAAALKIGQLVPIDALLSGTYTKLKSYIDVSARLIDVASGEILMSYNGRVKMNKNLATLFKGGSVLVISKSSPTQTTSPSGTSPVNVTINNSVNTGNTQPAKSKAEICKERTASFRLRLNDLSTQEKIDAVVRDAVQVPFDNVCGAIHYDIMYFFGKYKIQNESYHNFILHTLDTIAVPTADNRAYDITEFLAVDQVVDEDEWNSSLRALTRIGNYSLSMYLRTLISKPTGNNELVSQKRIDTYLKLGQENKIGLPRPVPFETVFFEMMEGMRDHPPFGEYVYESYSKQLLLDERSKASVYKELDYLYLHETQPQKKTQIINWLADFFLNTEYEKAHEHLYDFVRHFELPEFDASNEKIRKEYPEADLKILINRCKSRFSVYATATPYESQKEDRINFCVKYNIPVAGTIPSMEEARVILRGNNLDEQLRVMKLLELMGDRPKAIESDLINLFAKRSLEDKAKLSEIQTIAITVLGNTKTQNAKAIEYMISVLPNYAYDTESSKESLVKIGKAAVPALINRLDKTTNQDGGLQYQIITILGKIGKDAGSAEPAISRVLKINKNQDVVYAAEAALQLIK